MSFVDPDQLVVQKVVLSIDFVSVNSGVGYLMTQGLDLANSEKACGYIYGCTQRNCDTALVYCLAA